MSYFDVCLKPRPRFPMSYVMVFIMLNVLRWKFVVLILLGMVMVASARNVDSCCILYKTSKDCSELLSTLNAGCVSAQNENMDRNTNMMYHEELVLIHYSKQGTVISMSFVVWPTNNFFFLILLLYCTSAFETSYTHLYALLDHSYTLLVRKDMDVNETILYAYYQCHIKLD